MYKMENIKMTDDKKYYCEMQLHTIYNTHDTYNKTNEINN